MQVDSYSIGKEHRLGDMHSPKTHYDQPQESEDQENETEERLKKLTKFLRKISPLMEKELSENLPKYAYYGKN